MAKHTVYQILKSNRTLASQSVFYGISEAFTQATARQAFVSGNYSKNADVEAEDNKEVSNLVNNDRANSKVLATGPLRNVSVGDLIFNHETNRWFIVGPNSYDSIKIKIK